ncbi:MAG: hypothetical protein KC466_01025 [Myxococcales bacterium]|nr:hypothetical protein [Myxococcales bacterium]
MAAAAFVAIVAIASALYLVWGFRSLTRENRQIIAALPLVKSPDGTWRGRNLTWYGLLSANAAAAGVALALVLLGSVHAPLGAVGAVVVALFALCLPAAKLVARLVEGKAHTFTIGGASFVGVVALPWIAQGVGTLGAARFGWTLPVLPVLAAVGVAYAFGEGLGRLACLSFGCCYGRRVSDCSPAIRRLFKRWSTVLLGDTKKIAYAGGPVGERTVPVQSMTAVLYVATALAGTGLFFASRYGAAFALTILVTQGWRTASELLRADWRGTGRVSAYQVMSAFAVVYAGGIALWFPAGAVDAANVLHGLTALWTLPAVLFVQGLWAVVFVYLGRSFVTEASLRFHVCHDRI